MKHVIYRKHHMVNDFVHVRVSQGYCKGLPAEVLEPGTISVSCGYRHLSVCF